MNKYELLTEIETTDISICKEWNTIISNDKRYRNI
jgi:hypothetical protein